MHRIETFISNRPKMFEETKETLRLCYEVLQNSDPLNKHQLFEAINKIAKHKIRNPETMITRIRPLIDSEIIICRFYCKDGKTAGYYSLK